MEGSGSPSRIANPNRAAYRHWHPPPTRGKRVLIASGNDDLRRWLCSQFSLTGEYLTVEADACDQALHLAGFEPVDAMLVDIDLPEMGGHEFCRLVRRHNLLIPIILLSKREHSESEEILGFEAGANDFLAEPFALGVLLARLRGHLHDFEQMEAVIFKVGPYRFEPAKRLLANEETQSGVRLTSKETDVLKYLCRRAGTVVRGEVLLCEVWAIDVNLGIKTHRVETMIHRLRRKIERHPQRPEILITDGDGYRLAANDVPAGSGGRQMYVRRRAS